MNPTKLATITAACGVLAAIFGLWSQLKPILSELPSIIDALTKSQLFGFGSFLLALFFGMAVWWTLFLYEHVCRWRPHSCSDLWSVVAGWAVYIAQQMIEGYTSRQMAWAVLMGLFAGLLAFLLSRLIWHFWAPPKVAP